jgi:hypothetical protein
MISVPIDSLTWVEKSYLLVTPLGEDDCEVLALNCDNLILKPGEDARIRKAQIRLFCQWVLDANETIEPTQLQYIRMVLNIAEDFAGKDSQTIAQEILKLLAR